MKFGDILRELLEDHEINQKQLAADLNISAGAVGNYVRNNREPDFDTLKRIAAYFHVSIDFLLDFQSNQMTDRRDAALLDIFHSLTNEQKELYIEQGKLLVKMNRRQKGKEKSSPFTSENRAG